MTAMPKSLVYRKGGKLAASCRRSRRSLQVVPVVDLIQVGIKERMFLCRGDLAAGLRCQEEISRDRRCLRRPASFARVGDADRWLLDQWYADQGFIVVAIDGRGTPGRGAAGSGRFTTSSAPCRSTIKWPGWKRSAAKYPEMDLKRVGIDGWSFGGYMAALAVMRRPDVFQAGVAGAPVVRLARLRHALYRTLSGHPAQGRRGLQGRHRADLCPDLKRPLLILHGTADDNVYFRHSLRLVDALFRHGKDFEMSAPLGPDAHGAGPAGDGTAARADCVVFSKTPREAGITSLALSGSEGMTGSP